jgi:hypothetical protein
LFPLYAPFRSPFSSGRGLLFSLRRFPRIRKPLYRRPYLLVMRETA